MKLKDLQLFCMSSFCFPSFMERREAGRTVFVDRLGKLWVLEGATIWGWINGKGDSLHALQNLYTVRRILRSMPIQLQWDSGRSWARLNSVCQGQASKTHQTAEPFRHVSGASYIHISDPPVALVHKSEIGYISVRYSVSYTPLSYEFFISVKLYWGPNLPYGAAGVAFQPTLSMLANIDAAWGWVTSDTVSRGKDIRSRRQLVFEVESSEKIAFTGIWIRGWLQRD